MTYKIIGKDSDKYIELSPGGDTIRNEQDVLDLLSICYENSCNQIMLYGDNLAPEFFDLKTGLAGAVLQKFVNYSIKAAAIINPESISQGRFREMVLEANRGSHFRVFSDRSAAQNWLIAGR